MRIFVKDFLVPGPTSDMVTSAFHFFDPEIRSVGRVFGLVTITGTGDFDPLNVTRFVWNGIQDSFRENDGVDRVGELKKALEVGSKKLAELIKHEEALKEGVGLDIGLVHYVGNVIYFGFYGGTKIMIYHEDQLIDITELLKENKVYAGSTELTKGDVAALLYYEKEDAPPVSGDSLPEILHILQKLSEERKVSSLVSSTSLDIEEVMTLSHTGVSVITDRTSEEVISDLEEKDKTAEVISGDELVIEDTTDTDAIHSAENDSEDLSQELPEQPSDDKDNPNEAVSEKSLSTDEDGSTSLENEDGSEEMSSEIESDMDDIDVLDDNDVVPNEKKSTVTMIFSKISEVVGKILDLISNLFKNIKSWLNRFVLNKYGRKTWFKRIKAKFSQSRFSSKREPDIRLGGYREKNTRNKRLTIALLVVVAVIAGYLGVNAARENAQRRELSRTFNSFHEEVRSLLAKSETNATSNQEASEIALTEAERLLQANSFDPEALSEKDKERLQDLQGSVLGVKDILNKTRPLSDENGNFIEFLDSKIHLGNAEMTDIAIYKDAFNSEYLIVTDKQNNKVYSISTNSRDSKTTIPDPNGIIKEPMLVDIGNTGIYVYDRQTGVVKAPFTDEAKKEIGAFKSLSGVTSTDLSGLRVISLSILTVNDNIYVLDELTDTVYKANATASGSYTLPFPFFSAGESSIRATDFFADFALYLTSKDAPGIKRFTSFTPDGVPVELPFQVAGMREELKNVTAGFTYLATTDPLFLFDSENRSFLSFEKPDEIRGIHPNVLLLIEQFAYRGQKEDVFADVKDFVADSGNRKIYVVDGVKIWTLHLEK